MFAATAAKTITAGVRLISASIRIPCGITTDSHARNRAHPALSLMKWVLLVAPNRSGCVPVSSIQLPKCLNIGCGESGRGRAADVVGGLQQLAIVAEIARTVARLPEQIHDVVEVPRVLEAERVAELVERGQVDDDVARQRIDFDRRIRRDVD